MKLKNLVDLNFKKNNEKNKNRFKNLGVIKMCYGRTTIKNKD